MAIRQINPMLAQKKDLNKLNAWASDEWYAQEKFDGERVVNQLNLRSDFTGRRVSKKTNLLAEKTEHVPHLQLPNPVAELFNGTVLDGELIHPKYHEDIQEGFKQLSAVMRSLPERALQLQEETGWLEYHVYDILEYKGQDLRKLPFEVRLNYLELFFDQFYYTLDSLGFERPNIYMVFTARTEAQKRELLERIAVAGKEGLMFRHVDGVYEEGKKSHNLLKFKAQFDVDAVVMGFEEPDMEYTGQDEAFWHLWYSPEENVRIDFTLDTPWVQGTSMVDAQSMRGKGFVPVSYTWFHELPATVIFGCYKDGQLIERGKCSGFNYMTAHDMKNNKEGWLGEVIEVLCYGFYPSGKLRHPNFVRMRWDKNPQECTWE